MSLIRPMICVFFLVSASLVIVSVNAAVDSSTSARLRDNKAKTVLRFEKVRKQKPKDDSDSTLYFKRPLNEPSHEVHWNLQQEEEPAEASRSFSTRRHDDHNWGANITCDVCKVIVGTIQRAAAEQRTSDELIKLAIDICKVYKIESVRVCDLVVPQYSDMVLAIARGALLDPDEICGFVLGDSCAAPFDPMGQWNITISDKPKPPVKPRVKPKPGSPTLRVLHLTDIHLDIDYRAGADAECGEPLCCRAFDINPAPNKTRRAGQWGDYRDCDTPGGTLDQLFRHLANISDKFDYVIFTGDIAAHDIWNQTRSDQLSHLQSLTRLFRIYLPDKPVYPCPGNHEGVPCNSFPPDTTGESSDWLYSAYLEAWGYWLPSSVSSTIMRGGFYTFSPYPGFRIISFSTNYGASGNWWLMLNATDPQGQLQWMANVLQEAEDNGEKVHMLSHHPPGQMMPSFAFNFYRLVNRYENTIVGQFNGHTHKDEYEVFYDLHNKSRAVGMTYIGGSVTTYSDTNPAFRIYTIDGNYKGSSWEVLDYTHYYLDLPKANSGGAVTWQKEYSAMETYEMPSLYPQDWSDLVYRMKANDTLFQKYYTFYHKSAENPPCDDFCKRGMLCNLKKARPDDPDLCNDL